MIWTMPRPMLQAVAWLIGLAAISSFAFGIYNASGPARLPGEGPAGAKSTASPIQAMEATPLSQERIEGPPPPPELTEAQRAQLEADKQARAEADAQAKLAAAELAKQQAAPAAQPAAPAAPAPAAEAPPPAPTPDEPPF